MTAENRWGFQAFSAPTGWRAAAETALGAPLGAASVYKQLGDATGGTITGWPDAESEHMRSTSGLVYLNVNCVQVISGVKTPYCWDSIIAGDHDDLIRTWGRAIAAFTGELVVTFDHEPNVANSTQPKCSSDTPDKYRLAYDHFRTVVRAEGGTSCRWAFVPTWSTYSQAPSATNYWQHFEPPNYDVIGADVYPDTYSEYQAKMSAMLTAFNARSSKEILIGELGFHPTMGDRIPAFWDFSRRIRGLAGTYGAGTSSPRLLAIDWNAKSAGENNLVPGTAEWDAWVSIAQQLYGYSASPADPTLPDAPAAPVLTPGDTTIEVVYTAPFDGGSTIDDYRISCDPPPGGGSPVDVGSTSTDVTITGLVNGTRYAIAVAAHNSVGWGPYSTTNFATPVAPIGGVDHLTVTPAVPDAMVGQAVGFTVEAFDSSDVSLGDVTDSSKLTFTPSDLSTLVGAVFTPYAARDYTITATFESVSGSGVLHVTALSGAGADPFDTPEDLDIVGADLSTVLLDLNSLGGGVPGISLLYVDWGSVGTELTTLDQPPAPGAIVATAFEPLVQAKIGLMVEAVDAAGLQDQVALLYQRLHDGRILRHRLSPDADYRYADYRLTSVTPIQTGDVEQDKQALSAFRTVEAQFVRWPFFRLDVERVAESVAISQALGSNVVRVTNDGEADSEAHIEVTIPDTSPALQCRVAVRHQGNLSEWESSFTGFSPTALTGLTDYPQQIWAQNLTPSDPAALQGTFRVYVRAKLDGADVFHLELRSGATSTSPVGLTSGTVDLDASDITAFDSFYEVFAGFVTFTTDMPVLRLEMWAYADGGTNISWSDVLLMPCDEGFVTLASPGFRHGRFGRQQTFAKYLLGGTLSDNEEYRVLDANAEDTRLPPSGGLPLTPGRHVVDFVGSVEENDGVATHIGRLEVLRGASLLASRGIFSFPGRVWTAYQAAGKARVVFDVADGDSSNFDPGIVFVAPTSPGRRIFVERMRTWSIPLVRSGRAFTTDGLIRENWIASGQERLQPLSMDDGGFLRLPPGDSDLIFSIGLSPQVGYDQADDREPLCLINSVTAQVTVDLQKRTSH